MAPFWTEPEEIQDDCESLLIPESKEVQEKKKRTFQSDLAASVFVCESWILTVTSFVGCVRRLK